MVDQVATKPTRLWRTVLVISLALNLSIVGVVVGTAVTGGWSKGPPRYFDLGLGPMARALENEDRHAIGVALRQDNDVRRINVRGQMDALVASLRQDPFDVDTLRSLIADQASRTQAVQSKAQNALINQINAMSADDRAAFADRLEQELSKPRRSRSGG